MLACLSAGCCVVSTCEELAYPFRKHPELSAKLDAEAKEEGVALVGTGINPGFVMDKLVLTLSAASQRVDSASAVRIVDASKRRLPLQKKVGAGMSVEEFRAQVAAAPSSITACRNRSPWSPTPWASRRRDFRNDRAGHRARNA